MKKYELTKETIEVDGRTLHRIVALKSFADVKEGDLGGYVESESNLSHYGECWIYGDARVGGSARVGGYARVVGDACVGGSACVGGYACVGGSARVGGDACVGGYACVEGSARVEGDARVESVRDIFICQNAISSGRSITYTRSNQRWVTGCFSGSGKELIDKAYQDSDEKGKWCEKLVQFVENL